MKYIVETTKTVEQAAESLKAAVLKHQFGVLHVHNLKETMQKKGVDFDKDCLIFEICNPHKAKDILSENIELNLALPCRVSVYEDGGKTKIGMFKPTFLISFLSDSPSLAVIAKDVEDDIIKMINEAK